MTWPAIKKTEIPVQPSSQKFVPWRKGSNSNHSFFSEAGGRCRARASSCFAFRGASPDSLCSLTLPLSTRQIFCLIVDCLAWDYNCKKGRAGRGNGCCWVFVTIGPLKLVINTLVPSPFLLPFLPFLLFLLFSNLLSSSSYFFPLPPPSIASIADGQCSRRRRPQPHHGSHGVQRHLV